MTWGAFGAQRPWKEGFWDAVAPGFERAGREGGADEYTLRIQTANVTSWGSLLPFLMKTEADVLMVQELKVPAAAIDDRVAWLRRRGWNALITAAETGPNGGLCAGAAIIARSHVGMGLPLVGHEVVIPARAVAARLEPPGCRPFTAVAAYFHDGVGLGRANLDMLKRIGVFIAAQGGEGAEHEPFVLGADFQVTPADFSAAGFAREVGGVIMASGEPAGTCRTARSARELDYFVLSPSLAAGLDAVNAVKGSGLCTHLPVELRFRPRLTSLRALVLRKPPPLATERIIGPLRQVADWGQTAAKARRLAAEAADERIPVDNLHDRLGSLYKEWVDMAERELVECTYGGHEVPKLGLRGNAPVMVWRSILPERPKADVGDVRLTFWRNAANMAMGLQRLAMDARSASRGTQQPPGHHAGGDGQRDVGDDAPVDGDDGMQGRWECDDDLLTRQVEVAAVEADELCEQARALHGREMNETTEDDTLQGAIEAVGKVKVMLDRLRSFGWQGVPGAAEVAECREAIALQLDVVAKVTRAKHEAGWVAWLRDGIDAGARNAHKFLRLPPEWRPSAVRTPDGVVTTNTAEVVDSYRRKYVTRWNGHLGGRDEEQPRSTSPWASAPRCALPRTSAAELRAASKEFSADTAVAFDGLALRHYGMISDDGLEVLADIILAMELVGRLPPQLDALVMPLIGKERGGHRAITLATSLYRLWGRLRRSVSQQWEAEYERPYFAAGKGRRVQDVVWRQLVKAEAGEGEGRASAAVLWDMASFYDAINRTRLWTLVRRHNFPLAVARLAFSMYDAPRALALDGRIARPAYARNGVTAGCPFATAFTRLFCVDPFDNLTKEIRINYGDKGDFDSYVDDLVVTVTADAGSLADATVEIANWLRAQVEITMGCDIELAKAAVVSSDARAARCIARRLGAYAGTSSQRVAAVNLGCDFAPGRRRTAQRCAGKRRKRYKALARRGRRLCSIRKAVGGERRARRLFTTGLLAAAIPDAAVNGVSDREALALRRTAALACSPRARGRSLATLALLSDLPTWRAENEIILQYSRQVWEAASLGHATSCRGVFSLTQLSRYWEAVDKDVIFINGANAGRDAAQAAMATDSGAAAAVPGARAATGGGGDRRGHEGWHQRQQRQRQQPVREVSTMQRRAEAPWRADGRRRDWSAVKGPIGAMVLTLHRLGWRMSSPFMLINDWNEEVPLTKVSPAMLADMLRDATRRAIEHYLGAKAAANDEEFVGRRLCLDQVKAQLQSDKKLSAAGRAAVRSVICNAVMTYSRAAATGYLVEDVCPLCGCAGDTLHHRIWGCMHPEVVAARQAAAPQWLRDEVARRPRSQSRWVTGAIPHPGDLWPRPASGTAPEAVYEGHGEPPLCPGGVPRLSGKVYVDGSCSTHCIHELRRAATSLVTIGADEQTRWRISLPVPAPVPQTSQAAEFVAVPLLHAYLGAAEEKLDVGSDCSNVVRSCVGPAVKALAAGMRYSGIIKPALADPRWARAVGVRKVPAHVAFETMARGAERLDAVGNDRADAEAKLAVQRHPQASPALQQDLDASIKRSRLVVRTVAAVMPLFPPMPATRMARRPIAREGATVEGEGGHRWRFANGCWRCEVCWTLTVKPEIDAALAHRRCDGPKRSLEAASIVARGHVLAQAAGQVPILFCMTCGSFSSRRAYGLGGRCSGTPSKAGAQALSRIRRGLQPWRTRHDRAGPRPRIGGISAWSDDRARFVSAAHSGRSVRRRVTREDGEDAGGGGAQSVEDRVHWQELNMDTESRRQREMACDDAAAAVFEGAEDEIDAIDEEDVFGHGGSMEQPEDDGEEARPGGGRRHVSFQGHVRHYIAAAMSTGGTTSAADARVGPGGPQAVGATVAVAPTFMEGATATVATASDRSTILHVEVGARLAEVGRGEVDRGPPGGCVAPPEGDEGSMGHGRQVLHSPLVMPNISGAGPRHAGLDGKQEVSEWSAEEIARRRDGVGRPALSADGSVGRRHSSCAEEWEEPDAGSRRHAPSARQSECSDVRVARGADGIWDNVVHRERGNVDGPAKRPRVDQRGPPSVANAGPWVSAAAEEADGVAAADERDGLRAVNADAKGVEDGHAGGGPQGHPRLCVQRGGRALGHCGRDIPQGSRDGEAARVLGRDDPSRFHGPHEDVPHPCGTSMGKYTVGGSSSSDGIWQHANAVESPARSVNAKRGLDCGGAGIAARRRTAPPCAELHQRDLVDLPLTRHRCSRREQTAGAGARPQRRGPLEIWERPPAWLYLPHLGLLGHGNAIERGDELADEDMQDGFVVDDAGARQGTRARSDDQADGAARDHQAAEGSPRAGPGGGGLHEPIRGRAATPGREVGAGDAATTASAAVDRVRGAAEIRGRGSAPGPALGSVRGSNLEYARGAVAEEEAEVMAPRIGGAARRTAAEEERRIRAQLRLDARNAGLARSLQDHAERVKKRSLAGDRPAQATARERVEALRRRIGEKFRQQSEQRTAHTAPAGVVHQATGRAGYSAPATGGGGQGTPPVGTTEVLKIHLVHDNVPRIHVTTAAADDTGGDYGSAGSGLAQPPALDRGAGHGVGLQASGRDTAGEAVEASAAVGHADYAREAAASRVAWHSAAHRLSPLGGGAER